MKTDPWESPHRAFITPQGTVDVLWPQLFLYSLLFGWKKVVSVFPEDNPIAVDMAIRLELTFG